MTVTLEDFEEKAESFAHASALILQCSIWMIRDLPNSYEREAFKHGVTDQEMRQWFPKFMWTQYKRKLKFKQYQNRMRDNVNIHKTMRRHDVHGERHFYAICLDKDGLVDHSRCQNCTQK